MNSTTTGNNGAPWDLAATGTITHIQATNYDAAPGSVSYPTGSPVIGATTASGLAQGLEVLAREGNMSEAEKLAAALGREMDRLMQSLLASKRG